MYNFPQENLNRLVSMLSAARRPVLLTHTHPDGDAVGSVSGLYFYLTQTLGKPAKALFADIIPDSISFIGRGVEVCSDPGCLRDCDLLVCTDFNSLSRAGSLEDAVRACKAPRILFDHHLFPNKEEFDLVFSETAISSACELVFWVLRSIVGTADALPLATASALMAGMTTDTNNFANSVYPGTLQMASELLERGVDRDAIIDALYKSYRPERLRAITAILASNMQLCEGFAYIIIPAEDMFRLDVREGELEGLVNIPLGVKDVKISITAKQDGEEWRLSVRSKKGWSANRLAKDHLHGGGHEQAAGGRLNVASEAPTVEALAGILEKIVPLYL